jgi:hypothetical protein
MSSQSTRKQRVYKDTFAKIDYLARHKLGADKVNSADAFDVFISEAGYGNDERMKKIRRKYAKY